MNLRKKKEMDNIDIGLKHSLKNWAARQHPPADGRSRLMEAAVKAEKGAEKTKAASFFLWALNDDTNFFYMEHLTKVQFKFVMPGAASVN